MVFICRKWLSVLGGMRREHSPRLHGVEEVGSHISLAALVSLGPVSPLSTGSLRTLVFVACIRLEKLKFRKLSTYVGAVMVMVMVMEHER